jgi:hypothetical protein
VLNQLSATHWDVWGSGDKLPILDFGTRWRLIVTFTPLPLYPWGKGPGTHWIGDWVGDLSDERTGLSFTTAPGPRWAVIFGSDSLGTRDHILLSQIRDFPFRRLLRLAGLRWRYSTPPPHRSDLNSRINSLFITSRETNIDHHVVQLILVCYSPVAAETGVVA